MNESMYWPAIALAALNFSAVALWIATLRLRFVLATGSRASSAAGRPASRSDETEPLSVDAVERRLADDIRRWRAAHGASAAAPDRDDLEPWIAEVERSERRADSGRFLPRARRSPAGRAASGSRNAESSPSNRWHEV